MFKADKKGFFVVDVDDRRRRIVLSCYGYNRTLKKRFMGKTAEPLWDRVIDEGFVSDLTHAAYVGRELARAEIALRYGLRYKQDGPLHLDERLR